MKSIKVVIANDHRGYKLKEEIKKALSQELDFIDLGSYDEEVGVDYPDFAEKAAREVSEKRVDYAILICSSGLGMAIVANKFPGVRAGVIHDVESAKRSRQHNDLNVLCLSSLTNHRSVDVVRAWIHTPFEGGRHQKRIEKITKIEQSTLNRLRGKKWH